MPRKKTSVFILVLIFAFSALALYFSGLFPAKKQPAVLYLPLDNRPVNYDYVVSLSEMAGIRLVTPPPGLLNTGEQETDAAPLWDWVEENAGQVSAMVLSLDSLFYGGLVPSRTHHLNGDELDARTARLDRLVASSNVPVFAFSTMMRSTASAASAGQPDYFALYGDKIKRLSYLTDRADQGLVSPAEDDERLSLGTEIPAEVLRDYLERRALNHHLLFIILDRVERGHIDYFAIGRDDTAPFSFTRLELRRLQAPIARANEHTHRVDTYPGTDETGALLFARAVHTINGYTPRVHVSYAAPGGAQITPRYEDIPLEESITARLRSLGAEAAETSAEADLVLLVNVPAEEVGEASLQELGQPPTPLHRALAGQIQSLQQSGKPVALADVAYANGADDALLSLLAERKLLPGLAAYSGWNTAGNSLGITLAHGSLYSFYSQLKGFNRERHTNILLTRLIEDWGFQVRVRPQIFTRHNIEHGGVTVPDEKQSVIRDDLETELTAFMASHLSESFPGAHLESVQLPWNRLFELSFYINLQ